jgi:hypothetical protein
MSEQENQWEYRVLSTITWFKPKSPYDASQTELSFQDEAVSTVTVTSTNNRRIVIQQLGRGGWEMVNAVHQSLLDPAGGPGGEEPFYFRRPVKNGRKIREPKIEGQTREHTKSQRSSALLLHAGPVWVGQPACANHKRTEVASLVYADGHRQPEAGKQV